LISRIEALAITVRDAVHRLRPRLAKLKAQLRGPATDPSWRLTASHEAAIGLLSLPDLTLLAEALDPMRETDLAISPAQHAAFARWDAAAKWNERRQSVRQWRRPLNESLSTTDEGRPSSYR
jgi:hypothetical protein